MILKIKISLICTIRILNGRSPHGNSGIYVSQIWAHCDLKCGSDGHLKKLKTDNGWQVIAKLKLLLDLTQIISS